MEDWRTEKKKLVAQYHELNAKVQKGQIVFTGSSLMEMFPIEQWVNKENCRYQVYNRGVGGYRTDDFIPIIDRLVLELEPCKVFINIGTNDLSDPTIPIEVMIEHYDEILRTIESKLPDTKIYMMAYYPVNAEVATGKMKECLRIRTNEKLRQANKAVKALAEKHGQKYIDVNAALMDEDGSLMAEYTIEGMHIRPEGYQAIFPEVLKYINESE